MPINYSCFISYRHGQQRLTKRIIDELCQGLEDELEVQLTLSLEKDVYVDADRLEGGDHYNPALASAICQSACMVVVFTPRYFNKNNTYCAREFMAMEKLEEARMKMMQSQIDGHQGMILALVFGGDDEDIPPQLKEKRQYYDFRMFKMWEGEMGSNPKFGAIISEIAGIIARRTKALVEISDSLPSCSDFVLPSDDDAIEWLDKQPIPRKKKFVGR